VSSSCAYRNKRDEDGCCQQNQSHDVVSEKVCSWLVFRQFADVLSAQTPDRHIPEAGVRAMMLK
jgi:hypothetical protein